MRIVREKVKPERDKNNRKVRRERWWQFAERAPELYTTIAELERVLVRARVANINSIAFFSANIVCSEQIVVFVSEPCSFFAVLQSAPHTEWLTHHASSMRTDVRYTPSDCFDTFPFPKSPIALISLASVITPTASPSCSRARKD
jgi:hypothetical protein